MVKANRVAAQLRQMWSDPVGFSMGRKVSSKAQVHAPESHTLIASVKVAVFDMNESRTAGRLLQQP